MDGRKRRLHKHTHVHLLPPPLAQESQDYPIRHRPCFRSSPSLESVLRPVTPVSYTRPSLTRREEETFYRGGAVES